MSNTLEDARVVLTNAAEKVDEACRLEASARAEYVRLLLLSIADEDPEVVGFKLSMDWEYDDESSYFATFTLYVKKGDDYEHAYDLFEQSDEIEGSLSEGSFELLGEEKTVHELRTVTY